jgi:predicted DNA-binding transcriptional regulator AlpA
MVAVSSQPMAKAEVIKPGTNLSGMEEIAQYTRRSKATVLGWIKNEGFPAAKLGHVWESDKGMIDQWKRDRIELSRLASLAEKGAQLPVPKMSSSSTT